MRNGRVRDAVVTMTYMQGSQESYVFVDDSVGFAFISLNLKGTKLRSERCAPRRGKPARVVTLSSGLHWMGKIDLDLINKGQVLPHVRYIISITAVLFYLHMPVMSMV